MAILAFLIRIVNQILVFMVNVHNAQTFYKDNIVMDIHVNIVQIVLLKLVIIPNVQPVL